MTDSPQTIKLDPRDNVLVALNDLAKGQALADADIPAGHKLAAQAIPAGEPIYKYGQVMGFAGRAISIGEHVHVHNVILKDFTRDYAVGSELREIARVASPERDTFLGYLRPDGRVGTRNYVGILPTVNCSASVAGFVADAVKDLVRDKYPNVDGVVALTHGSGCCMVGEGLDTLRRTLAGYARHPNFAGVVLLGLGCETNLVDELVQIEGLDGEGLFAVNIQGEGGTRRTMERAIRAVEEMLAKANELKRQKVPAEHLVLGLECGGSDAYSGISANPAMGAAADLLIAQGGTAILSETPEIYGAEHLLTRRAVSDEVARKLIQRVKWWEEYTCRNQAQINNNPSPGNKAGGITTILEKSLGAVAKAGNANLSAVYQYAEPVTARGLVFMDTPGNDPVSITGMVAGGANLVCFTTGRGTVYGCKPTPTLKLATNTAMYERLSEDMDINCGVIVDGEASIAEVGRSIYQELLAVASGKPTKSEALGFGEKEFVPWYLGAVL